jgi:hypothetical protein
MNAALEEIVENIGRICIVSGFTAAAPFDAQRACLEDRREEIVTALEVGE